MVNITTTNLLDSDVILSSYQYCFIIPIEKYQTSYTITLIFYTIIIIHSSYFK